jgi:NAD(P)-dependent dehydrogenase (short-subunit alcohol dehydrogenase family)
VNAIAPAGIATDKAKSAGFLAELAAHTPLERNAEPDEIAGWIAMLLGEQNTYMTRDGDRERWICVCVTGRSRPMLSQGVGE